MRERQQLDDSIGGIKSLEQDLSDNIELIELGEMEDDKSVITDARKRFVVSRARSTSCSSIRCCPVRPMRTTRTWKSTPVPVVPRARTGRQCCFACTAGGRKSGASRSKCWNIMTVKKRASKSATLLIKGENAYGWLKTESGVHRLVRISPYDSNARRHTSFSSAWVYPVIDDSIEIDINESDCRIDTYRASGAGGQHVNTTDSAVRITHQPTGIVVQCQSERSQHKNRATAWSMLKARLYEAELKKREEAANAEAASKTDIGWGHQIRSYVLQPYQLVKDLRTGVESTSPGDVLDGDLDEFMEAALAQRVFGGDPVEVADID